MPTKAQRRATRKFIEEAIASQQVRDRRPAERGNVIGYRVEPVKPAAHPENREFDLPEAPNLTRYLLDKTEGKITMTPCASYLVGTSRWEINFRDSRGAMRFGEYYTWPLNEELSGKPLAYYGEIPINGGSIVRVFLNRRALCDRFIQPRWEIFQPRWEIFISGIGAAEIPFP